MKIADIKSTLVTLKEEIRNLSESDYRLILYQLLNLVEDCGTSIERLESKNQELQDENNRLKGEEGKPNIRSQSKASNDISSEKERKRQ